MELVVKNVHLYDSLLPFLITKVRFLAKKTPIYIYMYIKYVSRRCDVYVEQEQVTKIKPIVGQKVYVEYRRIQFHMALHTFLSYRQ